jgi:hypothetical protein
MAALLEALDITIRRPSNQRCSERWEAQQNDRLKLGLRTM